MPPNFLASSFSYSFQKAGKAILDDWLYWLYCCWSESQSADQWSIAGIALQWRMRLSGRPLNSYTVYGWQLITDLKEAYLGMSLEDQVTVWSVA